MDKTQVPLLGPPPPATNAGVSRAMKGNKRRNTGPEVRLRQALWRAGMRGYRLDWRAVPGRPDIAFVGRRLAVFVMGCYWHRCPRCNLPMPKSNIDFWERKFLRNRERDERKERELRESGWTVISIWECQIKKDIGGVVAHIRAVLDGLEGT